MALLGNFEQDLDALLEGNILQEIRENNPEMPLQQAADQAMEIANDIRDQFDEDEIQIIVNGMIQGLGLDAAINAMNELDDDGDFVGINEDEEGFEQEAEPEDVAQAPVDEDLDGLQAFNQLITQDPNEEEEMGM
jgi:hypothetical protein